jgi:hypothetical protein
MESWWSSGPALHRGGLWYDWTVIKPPFYPTPPPSGASRVQRLSFVQRNYLYSMAWIVPMFAIGLLVSSVVIVLVCVGSWLVGIAAWMSLSARIRKERRGGRR